MTPSTEIPMVSPKKRFRGVVICAALFLVAFPQAVSSQVGRSRSRSSKGREVRSSQVQAHESAQTARRSHLQTDRMGRPEPRSLRGEDAAAVDSEERAGDETGDIEMEPIDFSTERQRRERRRAKLHAGQRRRQQLDRQRLEYDPATLRDTGEMLDFDDTPSLPRHDVRPIEPFEGLIERDSVTSIESKPRSYASRLRELERERELEDRRQLPPVELERADRRRSNPPPTIKRQLEEARKRTLEPRKRTGNQSPGAFTRRPAKPRRLPPEKVDSRGQVIDDEDPL
jgi:hypothetical protein